MNIWCLKWRCCFCSHSFRFFHGVTPNTSFFSPDKLDVRKKECYPYLYPCCPYGEGTKTDGSHNDQFRLYFIHWQHLHHVDFELRAQLLHSNNGYQSTVLISKWTASNVIPCPAAVSAHHHMHRE